MNRCKQWAQPPSTWQRTSTLPAHGEGRLHHSRTSDGLAAKATCDFRVLQGMAAINLEAFAALPRTSFIIVDRSTTGVNHPDSEFTHACPSSRNVYERI